MKPAKITLEPTPFGSSITVRFSDGQMDWLLGIAKEATKRASHVAHRLKDPDMATRDPWYWDWLGIRSEYAVALSLGLQLKDCAVPWKGMDADKYPRAFDAGVDVMAPNGVGLEVKAWNAPTPNKRPSVIPEGNHGPITAGAAVSVVCHQNAPDLVRLNGYVTRDQFHTFREWCDWLPAPAWGIKADHCRPWLAMMHANGTTGLAAHRATGEPVRPPMGKLATQFDELREVCHTSAREEASDVPDLSAWAMSEQDRAWVQEIMRA